MSTHDTVTVLNTKIAESELITPDRIYLDWSLFRDPYLGAAISLLISRKDQQESAVAFDYLQKQIPQYQLREFNDVAYYMPELNITASDILNRLDDMNKQVEIFFAAPFTCFIQTLYANLNVNVNHSTVKGKFKKIPIDDKHYYRDYDAIRLSINTYPLILSKRQHDLIGVFFTKNYSVDVEILSMSPDQIPLDFLKQMDEIYTNNLTKLLENKAFSSALSEMQFSGKRIFAAKHLGTMRPPTINPRAIETEFLRLHAVLDMLVDFSWISPTMLTYDLYPPVTPT